MEEEIISFLNKNRTFLRNQADRISDYFEMCCYNYIVKYYLAMDYSIQADNLIGKGFRYKLSPSGYPENFSFFKISKKIVEDGKEMMADFEIHHNLTVQSCFQEDIFLTPDISVINSNSIVCDQNHYLVEHTSKKFCFVKNEDLQTFCEVKQFNPFPELIFSFTGLYSEMISEKKSFDSRIEHIAPSLMISGKGNTHTEVIRKSIEKRYPSNIVYDLFEWGRFLFTKSNSGEFVKISSSNPKMVNFEENNQCAETFISEEDLPF